VNRVKICTFFRSMHVLPKAQVRRHEA
jgi:hypothetical protein